MIASEQPTPHPWWPRRLYQRCMDWLWFGLLTRDLYPYVPPQRQESSWDEEQWRRW